MLMTHHISKGVTQKILHHWWWSYHVRDVLQIQPQKFGKILTFMLNPAHGLPKISSISKCAHFCGC